jgi:hypothetical protein
MAEGNEKTRVEAVIVDVEIPFFSLVVLLVKVTLAAIPAAIVVTLVTLFLASFFAGYFAILFK